MGRDDERHLVHRGGQKVSGHERGCDSPDPQLPVVPLRPQSSRLDLGYPDRPGMHNHDVNLYCAGHGIGHGSCCMKDVASWFLRTQRTLDHESFEALQPF